jgi:hypothetical protein
MKIRRRTNLTGICSVIRGQIGRNNFCSAIFQKNLGLAPRFGIKISKNGKKRFFQFSQEYLSISALTSNAF